MSLGQQRLGGLEPLRLDLGPELGPRLVHVQVRVPDVHEGLLREPAHRRAVALGRRQGDLAAGLGGEPAVPSGHGKARGQPLDVPLERAGQGLVEVVDVEDQPPLRRGERAEVRQVGVPAQLHPQPGGGRPGQIRCHRQRRTAVEGERGHQHPPVPDRHQLRYPRLRLAQQQPDRVPLTARREFGMRFQRGRRPGILPQRHAVRAAQMLRRRSPGPARCPRTRLPGPGSISRHRHDDSLRARRRDAAGRSAPRTAPRCCYQASTTTEGHVSPDRGEALRPPPCERAAGRSIEVICMRWHRTERRFPRLARWRVKERSMARRLARHASDTAFRWTGAASSHPARVMPPRAVRHDPG